MIFGYYQILESSEILLWQALSTGSTKNIVKSDLTVQYHFTVKTMYINLRWRSFTVEQILRPDVRSWGEHKTNMPFLGFMSIYDIKIV